MAEVAARSIDGNRVFKEAQTIGNPFLIPCIMLYAWSV